MMLRVVLAQQWPSSGRVVMFLLFLLGGNTPRILDMILQEPLIIFEHQYDLFDSTVYV